MLSGLMWPYEQLQEASQGCHFLSPYFSESLIDRHGHGEGSGRTYNIRETPLFETWVRLLIALVLSRLSQLTWQIDQAE